MAGYCGYGHVALSVDSDSDLDPVDSDSSPVDSDLSPVVLDSDSDPKESESEDSDSVDSTTSLLILGTPFLRLQLMAQVPIGTYMTTDRDPN